MALFTRTKILYYLGAGASAQVLPLAKSVYDLSDRYNGSGVIGDGFLEPPRIKGLAYDLENFLNGYTSRTSFSDQIASIRADCKSLAIKANEFGDVDTYAKYLHVIGDTNKLNWLKCILSRYFSIQQLHKGKKIDKRYLPWLVGIMSQRKFPSNVKILSWNYDSQVQLAMKDFDDAEALTYVGSAPTNSIITSYPNIDSAVDYSNLSLIHLNGRAGFRNLRDVNPDCVFRPDNHTNTKNLIDFMSHNDIGDALHFAWEGSDYHSNLMKHVKTMIQGTTILVVIGYSFPFYNRDVDKEIFSILKNHLTKIYYQDPILDGQQLKAQFNLLKDFQITHIKQTDNFHIPFEY